MKRGLAASLVLIAGSWIWLSRPVQIYTSHGTHPGTPLSVSRLNMKGGNTIAPIVRLDITTADPRRGFGGCEVFQGSVAGDHRDWGGICVVHSKDPEPGEHEPMFLFYRLSQVDGSELTETMTWGPEGLTIYAPGSGWFSATPEVLVQIGPDGVVRAKGFDWIR